MIYLAQAKVSLSAAWANERSAFTVEQMEDIWDASGHAASIEALETVARRLFPDLDAPLYFAKGGHRAFAVADGTVELPQYTLTTHLCRAIGIMKDGSVYPY